MSFEEDNINIGPLKTKVDAITALLIMMMVVLAFNIIMLGISHQSNSNRLDIVEQAIRSEQR